MISVCALLPRVIWRKKQKLSFLPPEGMDGQGQRKEERGSTVKIELIQEVS